MAPRLQEGLLSEILCRLGALRQVEQVPVDARVLLVDEAATGFRITAADLFQEPRVSGWHGLINGQAL